MAVVTDSREVIWEHAGSLQRWLVAVWRSRSPASRPARPRPAGADAAAPSAPGHTRSEKETSAAATGRFTRKNKDNNWVPVAQKRLVATLTAAWTACSASATMCVTSELMVASSSPSYVLQLRIWSATSRPTACAIHATEFRSESSLTWPTSASQRSRFDEQRRRVIYNKVIHSWN